MYKPVRLASALALCGLTGLGLAACGSSGGGGGGGTVTIVSGTAAQSPDPQFDFTTQGNELYSVVYTPLLTYKRAEGKAGTELIPGAAKSLPKVSNGDKTYTFQLRPGLKYSNGQPIKASDFKFAIKRALRLNWSAKAFLTSHISGAEAYDTHKASDISGIGTDDKTGTITVTLDKPYGPIVNVLGLAGTAPLPQSTPIKPQNTNPPPGDGPFKWGPITPNQQYTLVKNTKFDIPGLPRAQVDQVVEKINSNVLADAQAVLNNQADIFDPGDTLPPAVLPQVQSTASDRYKAIPTNSSWYFFMNVRTKPFNNLKARQAVVAGIDAPALSRIDSGFQDPDCHLIPPGIIPNSPANCPFGDPRKGPNLALARKLLKESGQAGAPVTVWGEDRSPRKEYADNFTDTLNKIGFKAQEKIINSSTYFQVVGNAKTNPQAGFADWVQDFPNPSDFFFLMQTSTIQPQNSSNYGFVSDPKIDQTVDRLNAVPANKLSSVASQWAALDDYGAKQGYYAAFGHEKFPKFYSSRLDFNAGVFSVEYLTDLTSLKLK